MRWKLDNPGHHYEHLAPRALPGLAQPEETPLVTQISPSSRRGRGDCLNFQEFIIFGTKAPAASSSATPIAHIQSTVGWIGKRADDDEQIKSTEKPENGSKRSSETRLVQIQRPTAQISQRGQVIVENCSPDHHLANVCPLLHLSIILVVTMRGES